MEKQFYTIRDIGQLLSVSPSTVRRAIKAGELYAIRVGDQGLRVAESEVERYVADRPANKVEEAKGGRPKAAGQVKKKQTAKGSQAGSVREFAGETQAGTSWRLINADVLKGLGRLDDASVNCIITSPPYYWQRDYEVDGQIGHEATIEAYVDALVEAFREARRALKPEGVFFLNIGDTYYSAKGKPHGRDKKHSGRQMARRKLRAVDGPGLGLPRKSLIGIPWRVALALQQDGWTLRSDVIWQRPGSLPEPTAKDRPWRTFEHVFVFSKQPRYWFDREGLGDHEDVWRFDARPDNPGAHFAPFPAELVEKCLACGCPPGGTVLDPFAGSGTTLLAALERDMSVVGIELKEEYCTFLRDRLRRDGGKSRPKRSKRRAR